MPDEALLPTVTNPSSFVAEFNACTKPKDCLELVKCHGLSSDEFCALLHDAGRADIKPDPGLLGECLGSHHAFWVECASNFASHFSELRDLDIVAALRFYLYHFRLPGESGPIGRILEGFAKGFVRYNPPLSVTTFGTDDSEAIGHSGFKHVYATSVGWYVRPTSTIVNKCEVLCCVACGAVESPDIDLRLCPGCSVISFCRACARFSHKHGHAISCSIGYGRACVAAAEIAHRLSSDGAITYCDAAKRRVSEVARPHMHHWPRASPVKSEDSALVLSYAIVMLSTNKHNPSVKPSDKMNFVHFAKQVRGVNDDDNFPGDFLRGIYDAVSAEELKVRT